MQTYLVFFHGEFIKGYPSPNLAKDAIACFEKLDKAMGTYEREKYKIVKTSEKRAWVHQAVYA